MFLKKKNNQYIRAIPHALRAMGRILPATAQKIKFIHLSRHAIPFLLKNGIAWRVSHPHIFPPCSLRDGRSFGPKGALKHRMRGVRS